jgi:hypothetical protein
VAELEQELPCVFKVDRKSLTWFTGGTWKSGPSIGDLPAAQKGALEDSATGYVELKIIGKAVDTEVLLRIGDENKAFTGDW